MLHKWLVIIFITYISRSKVKSDENEVKLQKYLFANPDYHYMARPVKQTNTKIWANFSLSISQIVSIGELKWYSTKFYTNQNCVRVN